MLVELAEEDEGGQVVGAEGSRALLVVQVEELVLLADGRVLRNVQEDLGVLAVGSLAEVGHGQLASLDLLLELGAGHLARGGTDLLQDPVDDVILGSAAGVLLLLSLPNID